MQPGFYAENLLMLAKASAKLKRVEEAAEWRRKGLYFSTTHFSHMSHTPFPHISDLISLFSKCLDAAATSPEDLRSKEECRNFKI